MSSREICLITLLNSRVAGSRSNCSWALCPPGMHVDFCTQIRARVGAFTVWSLVLQPSGSPLTPTPPLPSPFTGALVSTTDNAHSQQGWTARLGKVATTHEVLFVAPAWLPRNAGSSCCGAGWAGAVTVPDARFSFKAQSLPVSSSSRPSFSFVAFQDSFQLKTPCAELVPYLCRCVRSG